jgi:hypothetical protein
VAFVIIFDQGYRRKVSNRRKVKRAPLISAGGIRKTFARIEELTRDLRFRPDTSIADGICDFIDCPA